MQMKSDVSRVLSDGMKKRCVAEAIVDVSNEGQCDTVNSKHIEVAPVVKPEFVNRDEVQNFDNNKKQVESQKESYASDLPIQQSLVQSEEPIVTETQLGLGQPVNFMVSQVVENQSVDVKPIEKKISKDDPVDLGMLDMMFKG